MDNRNKPNGRPQEGRILPGFKFSRSMLPLDKQQELSRSEMRPPKSVLELFQSHETRRQIEMTFELYGMDGKGKMNPFLAEDGLIAMLDGGEDDEE